MTIDELVGCMKANLLYFYMQAEYLTETGGKKPNITEAVRIDLINSWEAADEAAQTIIVRLASHE